MQEAAATPMARTAKVLRRSIHAFLQHYDYFTSTSALLALPFCVAILISQALIPYSSSSSVLPAIHTRLRALFDAAGFPPSSEFFALLTLKLSQTLSSSFLTLPFTLTFFLLAKASVIHFLTRNRAKPSLSLLSSSVWPFLSIYKPVLVTHVCNSLVILSANATAFSLLFFAFNCLHDGIQSGSSNYTLLLSSAGAVLYSIILANALVICNLALVLSGMERIGGSAAILKACILIRGSTSTALSLALPMNLAMAGTEALFQFRIMRNYHTAEKHAFPMAMEGLFIAYLYSILVVLDTVVGCIFFKSCKERSLAKEQELEGYYFRIDIADYDGDRGTHEDAKSSEQLPKLDF